MVKFEHMGKYLFLAISLLTSMVASAQDNDVDMADGFYSSGKIYVVVAVLAIIFAVMFVYLISIDRKVNKLKKESEQ